MGMDATMQQKDGRMHINLNLDMGEISRATELYFIPNEDGQSGTTYMNNNGTWVEQAVTQEDLKQQTSPFTIDVPEGAVVTNAGTAQFNGHEATVLEYALTGDALLNRLSTTQGSVTEEEAEMIRNMSVTSRVYVDPATNLPLGTETDMAEVYTQLMNNSEAQMFTVSSATQTTIFNAWGTDVANITLPEGVPAE